MNNLKSSDIDIFSSRVAIKVILFICMILIITCCLSSLLGTMTQQTSNCNCDLQENFSNDDLYSFNQVPYADYQTIQLQSDNSLLGGIGKRYVYVDKDGISQYKLELYLSLYSINGNPFDSNNNTQQQYNVYLIKDDKKKLLGQLYKDGDQTHKFKYVSDKVKELIEYDRIVVTYVLNGKEQDVVAGQFNVGTW